MDNISKNALEAQSGLTDITSDSSNGSECATEISVLSEVTVDEFVVDNNDHSNRNGIVSSSSSSLQSHSSETEDSSLLQVACQDLATVPDAAVLCNGSHDFETETHDHSNSESGKNTNGGKKSAKTKHSNKRVSFSDDCLSTSGKNLELDGENGVAEAEHDNRFEEYKSRFEEIRKLSSAIVSITSALKSKKFQNAPTDAGDSNPSTSEQALNEDYEQLVQSEYLKYVSDHIDADDPFTNKCLKPLAGGYFLVAGMLTTAVGVLGATCTMIDPESQSSIGRFCSGSSSPIFEISSERTELRTVMGVGAALLLGVVQLLAAAYSFTGTTEGRNNSEITSEETRPLLHDTE